MTETMLAEMSANVWKILVTPGDAVEEDQPVMILESMKMEIPVLAEMDGTVVKVLVAEGDTIGPGQPLVELSTE